LRRLGFDSLTAGSEQRIVTWEASLARMKLSRNGLAKRPSFGQKL
jgi:hypothetical protein